MKKIAILLITLLGISYSGMAQDQKGKTERIKLVPVSKNVENESTTPKEEIKKCENQLEALSAKEEWIRNNPSELEAAKKNGWFEMAEKQRKELRARINELKK